jgi:hypothetical protein
MAVRPLHCCRNLHSCLQDVVNTLCVCVHVCSIYMQR